MRFNKFRDLAKHYYNKETISLNLWKIVSFTGKQALWNNLGLETLKSEWMTVAFAKLLRNESGNFIIFTSWKINPEMRLIYKLHVGSFLFIELYSIKLCKFKDRPNINTIQNASSSIVIIRPILYKNSLGFFVLLLLFFFLQLNKVDQIIYIFLLYSVQSQILSNKKLPTCRRTSILYCIYIRPVFKFA
jgi:uncharacterized membrane protein